MRARVRREAWSEGVAPGGAGGSAPRGFLSSRDIQVWLAPGFCVVLSSGTVEAAVLPLPGEDRFATDTSCTPAPWGAICSSLCTRG